ncbi:MAG: hypothetical protein QOJ19_2348 [Acidimicrobiia bacterium]|jgi:hypothetical protein|nr:hypothetical protein [Acidimicrobiia bacterium]
MLGAVDEPPFSFEGRFEGAEDVVEGVAEAGDLVVAVAGTSTRTPVAPAAMDSAWAR